MNLWSLKAPFYHLFRKPWPLSVIYRRERQNISTLIDSLPPLHGIGLDIGCGNGDSLALAPQDLQMLGIDASFMMARQTQHKLHIPVIMTQAPFLPIVADSCVFILAVGLLEYLDDATAFFSQCSTILQPNGYLLVTSSPPGLFTTARKIGGARIIPRNAQKVIDCARQQGLGCVAHTGYFSQDAMVFVKK